MARRVFYSFHYQADCSRAAQIRNMGVVDGNPPASDNDWESIKKGGDSAIQRWIDRQLDGKSCAVVLIGSGTAGRKWINYEIDKSWTEGKGLLGIHIHRLKDLSGEQSNKGRNPFAEFTLGSAKVPLSSIVKSYDPPHQDSRAVYGYIKENLPTWIEEAIKIRAKH